MGNGEKSEHQFPGTAELQLRRDGHPDRAPGARGSLGVYGARSSGHPDRAPRVRGLRGVHRAHPSVHPDRAPRVRGPRDVFFSLCRNEYASNSTQSSRVLQIRDRGAPDPPNSMQTICGAGAPRSQEKKTERDRPLK